MNADGKMKDVIPPYPIDPKKAGGIRFTDASDQEETVKAEEPVDTKEPVAIDIKELAGDLVDMGFKMWTLINPKVPDLSLKEKNNIALPLAGVIEKYDLTKYMHYISYTQEILLVYNLGTAVAVRVKELKKPKEKDSFKNAEVETD